MVVGAVGLLLLPALSALWIVIAGLGSGATLVVALSLISFRGRSQQETTQLSGMAQSLGYLLAMTGPIIAGYLAEFAGNWHAPLVMVGSLAAIQVVVAVFAGRGRRAA